jgi:hypothetical protein
VTWSANGHQYAVVTVDTTLTWEDARAGTAALPGNWYLATITSPKEQAFVSSLPLHGIEFWLGGLQNPVSTVNAGDNWTWVTGETFTYANWNRLSFQEPNDYYGPGSEQYLAILGSPSIGPRGAWNDEGNLSFLSGYVIERGAPTPEPGALTLTALGLGALTVMFHKRLTGALKKKRETWR